MSRAAFDAPARAVEFDARRYVLAVDAGVLELRPQQLQFERAILADVQPHQCLTIDDHSAEGKRLHAAGVVPAVVIGLTRPSIPRGQYSPLRQVGGVLAGDGAVLGVLRLGH